MTTIKKEISITGNGLMKNKPCTVKFVPSKEGKIRYFIGNAEPFEGLVENVLATDHCVVMGKNTSDNNLKIMDKIGKGGKKKNSAMLTEHLSAALAFCGIDSIDIYMDETENE